MVDLELRRELVDEFCFEDDDTITFLDNPSFDKSIIGVTDEKQVIYDYNLMVKELMEDDDMKELEAIEFIDYNTMRAIPYFPNAPIIMTYSVTDSYTSKTKKYKSYLVSFVIQGESDHVHNTYVKLPEENKLTISTCEMIIRKIEAEWGKDIGILSCIGLEEYDDEI